jgi:hypothetical protein
MEYSVQVNGIPWRKGAKCVKLVVGCSLLVEVSVHGDMLTMAGSWWGENVITPLWFTNYGSSYRVPYKTSLRWFFKLKDTWSI